MTGRPDELENRTAAHSQTQLRKVSRDTLVHILAAHRAWLQSDGAEGERADLSSANLKGVNLQDAMLQRQIL